MELNFGSQTGLKSFLNQNQKFYKFVESNDKFLIMGFFFSRMQLWLFILMHLINHITKDLLGCYDREGLNIKTLTIGP